MSRLESKEKVKPLKVEVGAPPLAFLGTNCANHSRLCAWPVCRPTLRTSSRFELEKNLDRRFTDQEDA